MRNNKIILIGIALLIILGVSYFSFYNTPSQPETNGGEITTATVLDLKADKTTTVQEENILKEPGITEQVNIKEDGFNKTSITIKEREFEIMNKTEKTIVLVGNKFFEEGEEIIKRKGVGLPVENFSNQNIKEITFWFKSDSEKKRKLII